MISFSLQALYNVDGQRRHGSVSWGDAGQPGLNQAGECQWLPIDRQAFLSGSEQDATEFRKPCYLPTDNRNTPRWRHNLQQLGQVTFYSMFEPRTEENA